ncbi:MAG: nitroreductase family protein [Prevotella sp.]|nr:nitroreductase family protein [Prevotella sp.]
MDFLELVKRRYSCRAYEPRSVEQEKVDYVMECVRMAPSAVNRQPWRFRIVGSEEGKERLRQCYGRDWFKTAPLYVIASVLHDVEWVRADGKHHGDIDIAIAVEHLCLAATAQGLATCWVCNFDAALCKQLFDLPADEEPAVIIPVGYAADEPQEKRRKTADEIVFRV